MAPQAKPITFGGIYAIRHIRSGKLYVGSAVNFSARWKGHRTDLRTKKHHSRYLQRAWDKYGADAFVFEILESLAWDTELIPAEQRYLDDLQSWKRQNGFNISPTAGSCLGVRHTAEVKAKMSASRKGRPYPENARAAIREYNSKRPWTPEMRAKIAESNRRRAGENTCAETRAKLAEAARNRKGWKFSPEARARLSAAVTGKTRGPQSPEHRARIAEAVRKARRKRYGSGQMLLPLGDK